MAKKYYKKELGQYGENLAKEYYKSLGYQIVCQNYYTRYGELDLVCKKNEEILIIEVKTRRGQKFGYGEEMINSKKLKNITMAYQIMQKDKKLGDYYEIEICVIELNKDKKSFRRFLV